MLKLVENTYVVTHHLYSFPFAYISSDDKPDTDFDAPCLRRIFRYQLDICVKRYNIRLIMYITHQQIPVTRIFNVQTLCQNIKNSHSRR